MSIGKHINEDGGLARKGEFYKREGEPKKKKKNMPLRAEADGPQVGRRFIYV